MASLHEILGAVQFQLMKIMPARVLTCRHNEILDAV